MSANDEAVRAAKERLNQGREEILARHRAGAGGQEVVRAISALSDEVIAKLFAAIAERLPGSGPVPLALVATGGYGRRELAPRSDIDLLALLPDGKDAGARKRADQIAEHLHRALWDAGLEAGYAARTLDQCVQLAREDHTIRTALLDGRLVAGDAQAFKGLQRATVTELEQKRVEEFIGDKLEEFNERRRRYGGSVWLLEPHLKQGKGGLRDLQAALWIARVRHKVAGLGEAGERGLLPQREVTAARATRDLLWRMRNELHYATGRRDDRLTFDNQRRVAQALGYSDDPGGELGVEKLMRETYIALQEIARASDALIDRCAIEDSPRSALKRVPRPQAIDAAFKIWNGRVTVNDREVFARRPADLVRLYAVAETWGMPVYSYARDLLVQELQRVGPQLATDREAHRELWQLLVREGSDGSALQPLHEMGVLGALFPEIARLRARAQHSLYHVYTVDTHTVFALGHMMRLRSGAYIDTEPDLTRVARAQQRPLILMLGLLFHDLGKGLGPDHSARGAELVRAYAQRIGLDPGDARDVEWLVLAHLRMSHISQRRDLEDASLIEAFASEVGTPERLEMLYLLTYADMSSVSAENWTRWKANLLRTLYEKTHATMLAEGLGAPEHARSVEARRQRLADRLAPLAGEQASLVPAFVKELPERYLGTATPDTMARHLKLWTVARKIGFAGALHRSQVGEADLTLLATDRPGLLAIFTAALAANGIDILGAEVNSLASGIALDTFVVRESGGAAPSDARWEAARADLLRLLSGAEDPHRLVQKRLRRAVFANSAAPAVSTKVRVDDVSSDSMTILDVMTQDRPGLLHTIADALHRADVSIEVARIATEGNRATDAFYLRDLTAQASSSGGKITDAGRRAAVVAAVQTAIASLAGGG
ncbi:MAG TPA: [protein-PII] uridylyltransferase [Myxococcales bacterium]|nr:[protein-PII] uridylyltransferase [Myxococcales bacterium]